MSKGKLTLPELEDIEVVQAHDAAVLEGQTPREAAEGFRSEAEWEKELIALQRKYKPRMDQYLSNFESRWGVPLAELTEDRVGWRHIRKALDAEQDYTAALRTTSAPSKYGETPWHHYHQSKIDALSEKAPRLLAPENQEKIWEDLLFIKRKSDEAERAYKELQEKVPGHRKTGDWRRAGQAHHRDPTAPERAHGVSAFDMPGTAPFGLGVEEHQWDKPLRTDRSEFLEESVTGIEKEFPELMQDLRKGTPQAFEPGTR